ncbi:hypothetical protein EON65_09550 [archaeon]|nr:MAG: hypothetical protein EON65_09550 [archaeon]
MTSFLVIFAILFCVCSANGSFISRTDRLLNGIADDSLKSDKTAKFDPYVDNGGTIAAIAGPDFVVIAADNRLSDNYLIKTRSISRLFEV